MIFLVFLACGVFADALAPHGINEMDLVHRFTPPNWDFPLGTDRLGRDMLSRILLGARISMIVGFLGAALATVISVLIGVVSRLPRRPHRHGRRSARSTPGWPSPTSCS